MLITETDWNTAVNNDSFEISRNYLISGATKAEKKLNLNVLVIFDPKIIRITQP